jgi:AraC-like DNA-binding protein
MLIQFQSGAKPQTSEQQLEKLCAWIDSHIDESIGWPELIQQSGLDFSNIQYVFSRYKSTTPMTWIRNRRL